MTKLLGVLGDPISHSLSPLIQNHWIRQEGLDATYEAMRVSSDDFDEALAVLASRDSIGFNVTLPHKTAAFRACKNLSETAKAIGAVNTLSLRPDRSWAGDNTDAAGFLDALETHGIELSPEKKIIVIGAGGAARAVVYALSSVDCLPLILNRTEAKARQLSINLTGSESAYGSIDKLYAMAAKADLVINTVSLGHEGKVLNLPKGDGKVFYDISYGGGASDQLALAIAEGWQAYDGLLMLVAQAARSFELWFGIRPQTDEVYERCKKLVEALV